MSKFIIKESYKKYLIYISKFVEQIGVVNMSKCFKGHKKTIGWIIIIIGIVVACAINLLW